MIVLPEKTRKKKKTTLLLIPYSIYKSIKHISSLIKSLKQVSYYIFSSFFLSFLQELLTRHKILSAEFLEVNYDKVFSHYQRLLNSENYVTRRQSLKLLGELLLDRHNFTVNFSITIIIIIDIIIIIIILN